MYPDKKLGSRQNQSIAPTNRLVEKFSQIRKVTQIVFVVSECKYSEQPFVLLSCFW